MEKETGELISFEFVNLELKLYVALFSTMIEKKKKKNDPQSGLRISIHFVRVSYRKI